MSTVNEHTPLLHQAHHEQQDQHLDIRYPIVTVKELNQRVDELVNSTTDDQGLSDLVAHGGDAAFYVVVNSLLLQPLDKHNLLESWAIKVLEILLQDQRDKYHTRIRHILLHEWEDQGSGTFKVKTFFFFFSHFLAYPRLFFIPSTDDLIFFFFFGVAIDFKQR